MLAVLLGLPLATACGAGRNDENDKERATHLGLADAGSIAVRGARLVPASATTVGTSSAAQGYLLVVLVNHGTAPDALTNATVTGGAVAPGGAAAGDLTVAPGESIRFGDPDLGDTGPALQVSGLTQALQLGTTVGVTLTFQTAGTVTLDVPVIPQEGVGTTATSAPIHTTGLYPSPSSTSVP